MNSKTRKTEGKGTLITKVKEEGTIKVKRSSCDSSMTYNPELAFIVLASV